MLRAIYRSSLSLLPESVAHIIRRYVGKAVNWTAGSVGRAGTTFTSATSSPDTVTIEPASDPRATHINWRMGFAQSYFSHVQPEILRWAQNSREDDNFTYDLTDQNLNYLAATISAVTNKPAAEIAEYLREPALDLADYLAVKAAALPIDSPTSFGRRLGWYAIARATKPRVIVETGVHQGIGSVLLCSALRRNAIDGVRGKYYGTDINPKAGALLAAPFNEFGNILYGDSIASLGKLSDTIDLFINDSDHSDEYEYREYQLISDRLSEHGIVLGDNSHTTDALLRFSQETNRNFLFFKEQPKGHWYPGAGIGISYPRA